MKTVRLLTLTASSISNVTYWPSLSGIRQCQPSRSCRGHSRHPTCVIPAASIYEYRPWLKIVDYLHVLRTRVQAAMEDADRLVADVAVIPGRRAIGTEGDVCREASSSHERSDMRD